MQWEKKFVMNDHTTECVQAAIFKIKINNNEGVTKNILSNEHPSIQHFEKNHVVLSTVHRSVNMKPNYNDRKPDAI